MLNPFVQRNHRHLSLCGCLAAVVLLTACKQTEPINGCILAAANRREVLLAQNYLHPAIPARILAIHTSGAEVSHAVLIYHLPEGWCVYDDTFGSHPIHLPTDGKDFPSALTVAHAAAPERDIDEAHWFSDPPHAVASVAGTLHTSRANPFVPGPASDL